MDEGKRKDFKCGEDLWKKLEADRRKKREYSPGYEKFADLFARLGETIKDPEESDNAYKLSAYFHQISEGNVPKDIFKRVVPRTRSDSDEGDIWGVKVKRKITVLEHCLKFAINNTKTIVIVSLIFISHAMAYLSGFSSRGSQIIILQEWKIKAIENFEGTSLVINNMARELSEIQSNETGEGKKIDEIIEKIQKILAGTNNEMEGINYEKAKKEDSLEIEKGKIPREQEKWVEAIYLYQKSNKQLKLWVQRQELERWGIIIQGDKTDKLLRCEVADSLKIDLEVRDNICPPGMIKKEKQKALEAFEEAGKTYPSINQLMIEVGNELSIPKEQEEKIFNTIIETIGGSEVISYATRQNRTKEKRGKLVSAIYKYQKENQELRKYADGIIDYKGNTYKKLKSDVKQQLMNSAPDRPKNRP